MYAFLSCAPSTGRKSNFEQNVSKEATLKTKSRYWLPAVVPKMGNPETPQEAETQRRDRCRIRFEAHPQAARKVNSDASARRGAAVPTYSVDGARTRLQGREGDCYWFAMFRAKQGEARTIRSSDQSTDRPTDRTPACNSHHSFVCLPDCRFTVFARAPAAQHRTHPASQPAG